MHLENCVKFHFMLVLSVIKTKKRQNNNENDTNLVQKFTYSWFLISYRSPSIVPSGKLD